MTVLDEFFAHPQKKVLAIKGKWGVGKTFAWRAYASEKGHFRESAISYVSLFGANSITDIKRLILEKAEPLKSKELRKAAKAAQSSFAFVRLVPKFSNFANAAQYLADILLKNFVVCFDDIERRAASLELSTVFGLVSLLKEENNCRVVLIFNEDALNEGDQKTLKMYREKIIDLEFTYAPTVAENVALIFDQTKYPFALPVFQLLDIRNIRVFQQVAWNLDLFAPFTIKLTPAVRESFLRHVVVLTCLYHEHANDIEFSDLAKFSYASFLIAKGQAKEESREGKLLARVDYGYSKPDEFVVFFLQHGIVKEKELKDALATDDERERRSHIREKLMKIWSLLTANFQTSEKVLIKEFVEFLDNHATELSWGELSEICRVINELDSSVSTQVWTDAFILAQAGKVDLPTINLYKQATTNPALLAKLQARRSEMIHEQSIKSIVFRMILERGWSPEDVAALREYSEDNYADWLASETDERLLEILKQFQTIFNRNASETAHREIGIKLENALRRIGARSAIDSFRLRTLLGIDL